MKVALVIGGSSGVGLQIVKQLLSDNYRVYCLARRVCPEKLAISIKGCVTTQDYAKLFDSIPETIEEIYYTPAISLSIPLEELKEEQISKLWETNFFSPCRLIQYIASKKNLASLVFISSIASTIPITYDPHYSASKSALETFCLGAILELPNKIRIIKPAGIKTNFTYKRIVSCNPSVIRATNNLAFLEQHGSSPFNIAKKAIASLKGSKIIVYPNFLYQKTNKLANIISPNMLLYLTKLVLPKD